MQSIRIMDHKSQKGAVRIPMARLKKKRKGTSRYHSHASVVHQATAPQMRRSHCRRTYPASRTHCYIHNSVHAQHISTTNLQWAEPIAAHIVTLQSGLRSLDSAVWTLEFIFRSVWWSPGQIRTPRWCFIDTQDPSPVLSCFK